MNSIHQPKGISGRLGQFPVPNGQAFVFVADAADTFRRVDITTGLETEEWVEIRDGLAVGENVAASGVFALKSELLLEREEG